MKAGRLAGFLLFVSFSYLFGVTCSVVCADFGQRLARELILAVFLDQDFQD